MIDVNDNMDYKIDNITNKYVNENKNFFVSFLVIFSKMDQISKEFFFLLLSSSS